MQTLQRTIHPQTRIVDAQRGIVDYVASDETPDSFKEIILAAGWRFNHFQKNAPVVDSHDYSTIKKCVGMVTDFRVEKGQLIERVKWAIDVPQNELAMIGFQMTAAGYLKSCSVGFFPTKYLTPSSGQAWSDALKALRLPPDADVRTIYTEQEQVELSVCIIGANPNALAKARADGIIGEKHLEQFPELRRRVAQARPSPVFFNPPGVTRTPEQMKKRIIDIFSRNTTMPTSKAAFERIEAVRRDGTEGEVLEAVHQALMATACEQRDARDPIEEHLSQPGVREFWNAAARYAHYSYQIAKGGGSRADRITSIKRACEKFDPQIIDGLAELQQKNLDFVPGSLGEGLDIGQAMSQEIFSLVLVYGAFKTLGFRTAGSQFTKYANMTALPNAAFIVPSAGGSQPIPADNAAAGNSLLPSMNIVASLLNVARGLVEDAAVDLSRFMVETFTQGLALRIDWACFQGNGVADANNGGQTGIFVDNTITGVSAGAGASSVAQLSRADFVAPTAAVTPAALQRGCEFWLNPIFIPKLLLLYEANGVTPLLKTPAETGDGTWRIVGFVANWAAQAPGLDAPGAQIAAFGNPDSYLVAVREELALAASDLFDWNLFRTVYRAVGRVYCQTRQSNGLAVLSTARR